MVYENDGGTLQVVKNMIYLSLDGYLLFFSQFFFVRFVFFFDFWFPASLFFCLLFLSAFCFSLLFCLPASLLFPAFFCFSYC